LKIINLSFSGVSFIASAYYFIKASVARNNQYKIYEINEELNRETGKINSAARELEELNSYIAGLESNSGEIQKSISELEAQINNFLARLNESFI